MSEQTILGSAVGWMAPTCRVPSPQSLHAITPPGLHVHGDHGVRHLFRLQQDRYSRFFHVLRSLVIGLTFSAKSSLLK